MKKIFFFVLCGLFIASVAFAQNPFNPIEGSGSGGNATYEQLNANSDIDTDLSDGATASTVPSSAAVKDYADSVAGAPTNVTPVDTGDEDATFYPILVDGATGSQATETDNELYYNPSTGVFVIPTLSVTDYGLEAGDIPDLSGTYEVQLNNVAGLMGVLSDEGAFASNILGVADADALVALIIGRDFSPTGAWNTTGVSSWTSGPLKFSDADGSPASVGIIRYDNTITGIDDGGIVWHDGDEVKLLVDMPESVASACADDQVIAYDADIDKWYCKADSEGAGTDDQTLAEVLAQGADANDVNITSGADIDVDSVTPDAATLVVGDADEETHVQADGIPDADDTYTCFGMLWFTVGDEVAQFDLVAMQTDGYVDQANASMNTVLGYAVETSDTWPATTETDQVGVCLIGSGGVIRNDGWTGHTAGEIVYVVDAGGTDGLFDPADEIDLEDGDYWIPVGIMQEEDVVVFPAPAFVTDDGT